VHVGDVLDRALDRHDAHESVAVRHHGRHAGHADAGIFLEGAADLRVLREQLLVVDEHLHDAGREDLHEENIFSGLGVVRDAEHADPGQALCDLAHLVDRLADLGREILRRAFLAQTRRDRHVAFLVRQDGGQRIILRRVLVDFVHRSGKAAHGLAQLDHFRPQCHNAHTPAFFRFTEVLVNNFIPFSPQCNASLANRRNFIYFS